MRQVQASSLGVVESNSGKCRKTLTELEADEAFRLKYNKDATRG